MDFVKRHNEIVTRWGGLPSTTSSGSYNFYDQGVLLSIAGEKEIFQEIGKVGLDEKFRLIQDIYTTAYHEYRHWLDMTSSVYGLCWIRDLISISELKRARDGGLKAQCRKIAMTATAIRMPHYYSEYNCLDRTEPWQYRCTVGHAYTISDKLSDKHPIWFVRFYNAKGGWIVRQPISIASLLEARAVYSEMEAYEICRNAGKIPAEFKARSEPRFNASMLGRVYSPKLTMYSVAAHWFAGNHDVADIIAAYAAASYLAGFCLDAPSEWIRTIDPTFHFRVFMEAQPTALEMMKRSLLQGDRAALFFMLAADRRLRPGHDIAASLDEILEVEWQTNRKLLDAEAQKESNELRQYILERPQPGMKKFLRAIDLNLTSKSDNPTMFHLSNYTLPAIMLKDGAIFNLFSFNLNGEVVTDNVFDPRSHMESFFQIEDVVSKLGKFTTHGRRCFVAD